jgi:quercetin dioxygenase-like cupin family protein
MKTWTSALVLAAAAGMLGWAQEADKSKRDHTILTAGDVKWGDAPPVLPTGAKAAVLDGDPKREGVFVMRLKFPAGYKIAPHWHPVDERVTVISGSFHLGLGEKFDETQARKLPAGGFFSLPPKTAHFGFCPEETVIQICTTGPWNLVYVNPDDDPRKKP